MPHAKHEGHGARLQDAKPVIPVAAGCLINDRGEVLIAQRPVGKIAAGKWEFPGGKIEAGESPRAALARELREELGITIEQARPLLRVRHEYSDRIVILDTWRVSAFRGELHPHDAQALAWVRPDELTRYDLLAADQPIVAALQLPSDYVFTPPQASASQIRDRLGALPPGALLRLRLPALADATYDRLASSVAPACRQAGIALVTDRSLTQAQACGARGWHASSRVLLALNTLSAAPLWRFASCHSAEELQRARELGFDAAVLGSVQPTASHAEASPLGWDRFGALVQSANLPTYGIGGLGPEEREQAFGHYAQGVAGIRAYW